MEKARFKLGKSQLKVQSLTIIGHYAISILTETLSIESICIELVDKTTSMDLPWL